ncbi:MAG: hypothetical protein JXB36_09190, partial [Gammaproteobacteria bacterium]|nr:hypothetical protein [Gammaproteobacteria bacterium]
WAQLRFPEAPPRSLGALAARVPEPLAGEIAELEASVYGPAAGEWHGAGLAAALSSVDSVTKRPSSGGSDALMPLYR